MKVGVVEFALPWFQRHRQGDDDINAIDLLLEDLDQELTEAEVNEKKRFEDKNM